VKAVYGLYEDPDTAQRAVNGLRSARSGARPKRVV
jgi:hypothetical protein